MKYVDTNVFGYAIENHHKYGKYCRKILEDIQSGKIKAACSMLVLAELIGVILKINKELTKLSRKELDLRANIDAILSLPILWIELEFFIIKRAAEYSYNISGADYTHLATMEVNGIYEIITADEDFDKADFVRRTDPLEYQ